MGMGMEMKTLKLVRSGGICQLLLAGAKGNPCGKDFWTELPQAFEELGEDDGVRAIVIGTEGPHFSYGLDLVGLAPELLPTLDGSLGGRLAIRRLGEGMQAAFDAIAHCPKPVVAAVNGWCIGAGVEMIAACDLRLCSADAKFSLREVKVGIVPDLGGIQRLPYIVGEGAARYMALTGADIPAEQARLMGLVNEVLADREALAEAATRLAGQLAANPPRVVAGIKQVMNARMDAEVRATLKEALQLNSSLMQSEDFKEAFAAFAERRPANFTGK